VFGYENQGIANGCVALKFFVKSKNTNKILTFPWYNEVVKAKMHPWRKKICSKS
jgi:hypothetical protein